MSLTGARVGLLVALLSCGPLSCQFLGHPGPSDVAQGRYFSSGNPDYDTFFVDLYHLQVELKDAPDRAAEPRRQIAAALDVGLDADVIKEALGKRAAELGGKQVKLALARGADAEKPVSLKITGSPQGDDAEFVKTLEQALAKIGELKSAIAGWQKSLDTLPKRDDELMQGLDTAFASEPPGKRADVKKNLADGQKILELLGARAKEAERSNSELLDAVVSALGETAAANNDKASESQPEKAPSEKSDRTERKSRRAPAPPAPKPARAPKPAPEPPAPKPAPKAAPPKPEPKPAAEKPASKPAPAAAAKAPERSEVPPAPKPTQGTAKPDFEP